MSTSPHSHLHYEVIVVGGGHAGCEAALAAARLGARTLLLTLNNDHIAQMSCNPAIGGIAKGQLVREIDALGGEMALNTDASCIQFRMLNSSKGAAAQSPRAQCDRTVYQYRMKLRLELQENLFVHQAEASEILLQNGRVRGLRTSFGDCFHCEALILACGTFLDGKLHYGLSSMPGGRACDAAVFELTACLRDKLQLELGRLKTGTPVRVLGSSIDKSALETQGPDPGEYRFSQRQENIELPFFGGLKLKQRPCYVTYTSAETAEIARSNLQRSAMYSGRISGTGARYCPSFEDKVVRFAERERHHIYLEPEGNISDEYYLNGLSTSLPVEIQWRLLHSLPGLEKAHISRYAYAIEYEFVLPHQLQPSLALRKYPNLFLAGQINGTSGYEEAAAQGLIAGVNAARLSGKLGEALRIGRDQAYIGVMIDDLVTKEIVEPYRLFTSRAEYRLSLRQDNADRRLTRLGYQMGLVGAQELKALEKLETEIEEGRALLQKTRLAGEGSIWDLMARPDFDYHKHTELPQLPERVLEQLRIEARYAGYISRQESQVKALRKLDNCKIPSDFDYQIPGISNEARSKLEKHRPTTLGLAARIDGVTPAEIAVLQVRLR
ncbi:MAG: tRNA uridine-5-carboxymethylaminomethyl(34) synthesis enzyme MnmG [Lentisphaeria bacterium]|nr:tRNA uridine-5-carboxymethylaminomethyl(34) synthesis enzyme MnmG [Lentisphaeria bacterium]